MKLIQIIPLIIYAVIGIGVIVACLRRSSSRFSIKGAWFAGDAFLATTVQHATARKNSHD